METKAHVDSQKKKGKKTQKTLDDITVNTDVAEIESMIEIDPESSDKLTKASTPDDVEELIAVNDINTIVGEKMKAVEVGNPNDVHVYGSNDTLSDVASSGMTVVDSETLYRDQRDKVEDARNYDINKMIGEMGSALTKEQNRVKALDDDSEYREAMTDAVASSDPYVVESRNLPEFVDDSYDPSTSKNVSSEDDFIPTFQDLSTETEIVPDNNSDSYDDDDEYDEAENVENEIRNLPYAKDIEGYEPELITKTVRGKVDKITKLSRNKDGGDQSFINAINELRKKNYPVIQVPLVNSGFFVDMVGTGAQDMIMLYTMNDRDSSALKYEIDRMKTTINGVVSTYPNVRPENLKNMIHYADYQMMVFGRICATFNMINSVGTCDECGGEFKFSRKPETFLLNYDELAPRISAMNEKPNVNENSLLAFDRSFEFADSGVNVVMGHPDYISTVNMYNSTIKYMYPNERGRFILADMERAQFSQAVNILSIVRSLTLPNGVKATNEYQKFLGLRMLTTEEFNMIAKTAKEFAEQIIVPKFGVKGIVCPHCGKEISVKFNNIEDLIFFHTMVSRAMSEE